MLLNIGMVMVGSGVVLSICLVIKLAFKSDTVEVKNGKRRGDGRFKGIIA